VRLRRSSRIAAAAEPELPVRPPWALLSLLLRYPDERVVAADAELADELAALPAGELRDALARFRDGLGGTLPERQARYVETFDLKRRNSLYLTYYSHGDTRKRGMALLRLKKLYRADGLPMANAELPDHLAVILAYAALAPAGHGEAVLAEHRPALELLRRSLHDLDDPYAHLLDAVVAGLGALHDSDRDALAQLIREGPPEEDVGLEPYAPGDVMPEGAHA
jgi:nitrate reductase delta subunit